MSIGSAFNNATSGLAASARLAETVASNVANAMTPGYARRTTALSSLVLGGQGGGVAIIGTQRAESPQITAEKRLVAAAAGAARTLAGAEARLLDTIGESGNPRSIAALATAFETALLGAVGASGSSVRLDNAVVAATRLAEGIAAAAREAAQLRTEAEAEIERQVGILNSTLSEIERLNGRIRNGILQGKDVAALEDERGRLVDRIAEIVPLRTARRDGGEIAIFTASGGVLLDGRVWPLGFERSAPVIAPDMVHPLNGLTQDRGGPAPAALAVNVPGGLVDGGSLAALFEIRDSVARLALEDLDALARDLVERGEGVSVDGDGRGLFIDAGPGTGPGIAARLAVNPAVDPAAGGAIWRLRDGLDAAAPGAPGNGALLQSMLDAMTQPRNPGLHASTLETGIAGLAAEIASAFAARSSRAEESVAFLTGQEALLAEIEAGETGVDADAELQFLMLVEQAYAANARVLSVIDSLLKQLLEI